MSPYRETPLLPPFSSVFVLIMFVKRQCTISTLISSVRKYLFPKTFSPFSYCFSSLLFFQHITLIFSIPSPISLLVFHLSRTRCTESNDSVRSREKTAQFGGAYRRAARRVASRRSSPGTQLTASRRQKYRGGVSGRGEQACAPEWNLINGSRCWQPTFAVFGTVQAMVFCRTVGLNERVHAKAVFPH